MGCLESHRCRQLRKRCESRRYDFGPECSASVDLLARIRASLSSLSPAELRIAEIIEADPSLASTLTVNDLAERASTSTATVSAQPNDSVSRVIHSFVSRWRRSAGPVQRTRSRSVWTSLLPTRPVR